MGPGWWIQGLWCGIRGGIGAGFMRSVCHAVSPGFRIVTLGWGRRAMRPAESGGCGESRQASAKGMRARRLRRLKLQLVKAGDRTYRAGTGQQCRRQQFGAGRFEHSAFAASLHEQHPVRRQGPVRAGLFFRSLHRASVSVGQAKVGADDSPAAARVRRAWLRPGCAVPVPRRAPHRIARSSRCPLTLSQGQGDAAQRTHVAVQLRRHRLVHSVGSLSRAV